MSLKSHQKFWRIEKEFLWKNGKFIENFLDSERCWEIGGNPKEEEMHHWLWGMDAPS